MSRIYILDVVRQLLVKPQTGDVGDNAFRVKSCITFDIMESWKEVIILSIGGKQVRVEFDKSLLLQDPVDRKLDIDLPELLNKVGYPALLEEEYRIQSL